MSENRDSFIRGPAKVSFNNVDLGISYDPEVQPFIAFEEIVAFGEADWDKLKEVLLRRKPRLTLPNTANQRLN